MKILRQVEMERHYDCPNASFTISYAERSFRHDYQTLDLFKEETKIRKHVLSITRPSPELDRLLFPWTAEWVLYKAFPRAQHCPLPDKWTLQRGGAEVTAEILVLINIPAMRRFPVPYPCGWYFSFPSLLPLSEHSCVLLKQQLLLYKFPSGLAETEQHPAWGSGISALLIAQDSKSSKRWLQKTTSSAQPALSRSPLSTCYHEWFHSWYSWWKSFLISQSQIKEGSQLAEAA